MCGYGALYGLGACALSTQHMESLDVLQRRMLRRMVGWARLADEEWSVTMRRMRGRIDAALRIFPLETWSTQFLRRQFRMACRISRRFDEWAMRASLWDPSYNHARAYRRRGRPLLRWDDRLNSFARSKLNVRDWQSAAEHFNLAVYECQFIAFHGANFP